MSLRRASVTNPKTWGSYEQASHAADAGDADGVGFVLTADDPYCAVDLDHCVTGVAGVHPQARRIVDELASYTEISSSGSGLHIIIKASLPATCRHKAQAPWGGAIEVYDRKRFIALTGSVLDNHTEIRSAQAELDSIRARFLPEHEPVSLPAREHPVTKDDGVLLRRMFDSRNGARIERLWNGDSSAYNGDRSAGDLALCRYLAFWTGGDAVRIDALFRQSKRMRPKWDRLASGLTYGHATIAKVIGDS
jgi:putative DNA primase/helicase